MTDVPATLEGAVARFITDFTLNDIDDATMMAVKALIKDQFAVQIGSSQLPWSRNIRAFRAPHPGKATIVGEAMKGSASDAAYINASYGHGFEYDDFFDNAHPGCAVVPAAFAIGEEIGATVEQVIVALVAGYETYVRIGRLGSPALLNVGWQPHSVLGNFGAAAIAAKLYGLTEEQTFHALAIAYSHASGPTEYASTGGSIKRAHAGICVRNGIESAKLARAGITGPRRYLTGNRGLYKLFTRLDVGDDARSIFARETNNFVPGLSFKPYCCCAATFPFIEAMETFRDRANDIDHVEARIQTMADAIVGTRNTQVYNPRNIEELQYSLPAQMALAVLGIGNGYAAHNNFLRGKLDLADGSVALDMTRRMRLTVDPDLDRYPYFVGDVTVHFKNGTVGKRFEERAKGSPLKPYKPGEHEAKLYELTDDLIGRAQSERLFAAVDEMRLDGLASSLTANLIPKGEARS